MTTPNYPHDKLFRALLDDPERARSLLRDHLPPTVVAELADTPPEPVEGNFVDAALQGSQSDRLFQVSLKTGGTAYIYTLLEHKSTPDPRTPVQLLGYMARIWERHLSETQGTPAHLPAILPVVMYHGRAPWTVPMSVMDWLDAPAAILEQIRDFRYILRDLGPVEDADLARDRAVRAVLAALKHAFEQDVSIETLTRVLSDLPDGATLEHQVITYILHVYDVPRTWLEEAASRAKPDQEERVMATIAEQYKDEGRAEGRAEERAEAVLRILWGRFGDVETRLAQHVRGADLDALDAMLDRALTVDRPEDVVGSSAPRKDQ